MNRRSRDLFEHVRSEGGLLPPDLLKRIADGEKGLPGLTPESYHLAKGERLNEMINRSWNRLLGAWASFQEERAKIGKGQGDAGPTRERWLGVLFQELGYGRLETAARATDIEGKAYPISHFRFASPLHLIGFRTKLDERTKGVRGAATQSPHSLVQEFLNRSDEHLWGVLSNGLQLRLLRDNVSLTRQAYVEFDLEGMMVAEAYADFALLWLLVHESRTEPRAIEAASVANEADSDREDDASTSTKTARPEACWLEQWARAADEQGTRARDELRQGVEKAIEALGQGFLAWPRNERLREALRSGDLGRQDYYRELLRLVYRLLFLFVAEDRELLLMPEAASKPEARRRYARWYGTRRLRSLAERRRGSPHADLYEGLRVVMAKLGSDAGSPELALPGLGSFLWSSGAIPNLADAGIANRDMLVAVRSLAFAEQDRRLRAVDFRNLGSEELGSVYESLLELHPEVDTDAHHFALKGAAGSERKTTGSYYTPTSLINCLLESALDPVLDEACEKDDPEQAILSLKVCDPACGSGHFLIAAGHRIARRLAAVRTGEDEPAPEVRSRALRDVVGRCLYGVDLNPMAVELCKVSLWLEAIEPGKALSFLDSHIQCGNSILGTSPKLIAEGIPDEAWKPIQGDDKRVATAWRRQNREERRGQTSLFDDFAKSVSAAPKELARSADAIEVLPDDSLAAVQLKEERYRNMASSAAYKALNLVADAWCAAFVWPKDSDAPEPPIHDLFRRLRDTPHAMPRPTQEKIRRLAEHYRFFHWYLAFPSVFGLGEVSGDKNDPTDSAGGFDVVLANPPWDRIKLQEKEFFASRSSKIAEARNAAARRRLIKKLEEDEPLLYAEFLQAKRTAEGTSHLVRNGGWFPLCGRGDVNTYSIFAELMRTIISPTGRVGCIVPSGIATDDTTKLFFQDLADRQSLVSLYDFQSGPGLFAEIGHARYKFCLLTLTGPARPADKADFAFFLRKVSSLSDEGRRFSLSAEDIALINPNTHTCPVFRGRRDAEIAKRVYCGIPILIREGPPEQNPWGISFKRLFDMSVDSGLFRSREDLETEGWSKEGGAFTRNGSRYVPLYEAKMVHHFDHRFGDYDQRVHGSQSTALPTVPIDRLQDPSYGPSPRYWVPEAEVASRLGGRWSDGWLLGWRDICRSTDERTVIASVIPRVGVGDKFLLMMPAEKPEYTGCLLGMLDSFVFDYIARQKLGGTSLKYFTMKQLPTLSPDEFAGPAPWSPDRTLAAWISDRVIELTYTSWDLALFARSIGFKGPPFLWNEQRRFILRCELDAAFFQLYGIDRSDVAYILDTFAIVKRKNERDHGDYRTKHIILEIYDRLLDSIATGATYATPLVPAPADARAAHRR